MGDENEVKPRECPFCGGGTVNWVKDLYFMSCGNCGATGPGAYSKKTKALTAWNHRVDPARQALRELLFRSLVELSYVQAVENCNSGLCATPTGEEIIEQGIKLLGVKDLSEDALRDARETI